MAGGVEVLEEAGVDRPAPGEARRPWMVPVTAFVVGVFAGAVFFGPVATPSPAEVTLPDDTPAAPLAPGEEEGAIGVARAVPGFGDALVAIVQSQPGLEYLLWPTARGPNTRGIPVTAIDEVAVDQSGAWVASLSSVPDAVGGVLSLGRSTGMAPVVSGVDSFAWHDSAPGRIGFLRQTEGSWGLYEASAYPVPELAVDLGPVRPGPVLAYGDWGWVVDSGGGFEVVTDVGRTAYEGAFLDSRRGEFLILRQGSLVIDGGRTGPEVLSAAPDLVDASISPDGSRVAILESGMITVFDRQEGAPVLRHPVSRQANELYWAGEGFLAVPGSPRGLTLIDLEGNSATTVLGGYTVHWAGIIPLSGRS